MHKKILAIICCMVSLSVEALGEVTVKLPADYKQDSIVLYHAPILKLATAKDGSERGLVNDTIPVVDGKATIKIDSVEGGCRYGIPVSRKDFIDVFAAYGDEIMIDVTSVAPFDYTISGTPLANCMNDVRKIKQTFDDRRNQLRKAGENSNETMNGLDNEYVDSIRQYIKTNISNPDVAYAIMNLQGRDFVDLYVPLRDRVKSSIISPLLNAKYIDLNKMFQKEAKQKEMIAGDFPAPDFILTDMSGKAVSLSEFKGKWVILDFWGSWCKWCIKGFPELKEIYSKYKNELEIIGIDCNESEEDWKEGVAKYDLPWVNVYCPKGNAVIDDYCIQGYPTKVIINPDGKIKDIITGHTSNFLKIVASLIVY